MLGALKFRQGEGLGSVIEGLYVELEKYNADVSWK